MNKELIIFNPSIEDGGVEKNLFLLNPGKAIKKPIINEKKIEIKEILTVIPKPLIKNSKFDEPCSRVGSKMYQPQL